MSVSLIARPLTVTADHAPIKYPGALSARHARWLLVGAALAVFGLLLVLPLVAIFAVALSKGLAVYAAAMVEPEALSALRLSLTVVAIVVPINTVFGVALAWSTTKFNFPGRSLLLTLIDLPFAVSPVVAGLVFVLLFGAQGWWGGWLLGHGFHIIFGLPGIVLASLFVTCPYVARQLVPLLEAQGSSEEEAAVLLGANGWQTFFWVTLPNIRWALLNGVTLYAARTLGEFGAVSVVSGHIRGRTDTLPLQVEILYNEYHFVAAFAVASLLALFALATLLLKHECERRASLESVHGT